MRISAAVAVFVALAMLVFLLSGYAVLSRFSQAVILIAVIFLGLTIALFFPARPS